MVLIARGKMLRSVWRISILKFDAPVTFFSALAEAQDQLQNSGTKTQPLTTLFALCLYNL
jgi:hypothetical protein